MSSDTIAALGAFLTGAGAVLGSMRSMRRIRRKDKDECDERVAEVRSVFRAGYKQGMEVEPRVTNRDERPEENERWSHLP